MSSEPTPNPVLLRRLALARAVLALIDMADDRDALLAILNADQEAQQAGGLTQEQVAEQNAILEAKPFSPAEAAQGISRIIAANHGGGSMVSVAVAASIDLGRTIKWIDSEVSQIIIERSGDSEPRNLTQRLGNIRTLVSGVSCLLEPASARTPYRHGPADHTWIAAE